MKSFQKIASFILILNIVFSTMGISRNAHYCGDKLSSLTYFAKASCCCSDTEDDTDGCCKNERTIVQLKCDFVISHSASIIKPGIISTIFIIRSVLFNEFCSNTHFTSGFCQSKNNYHSPPLYLQNKVLII